MPAFYLGLALLCGSTMMYEIVLTRLLSVVTWYYLAFVAISMAMFGMTAGALIVQLRPDWFKAAEIRIRLAQTAFGMALSMPITLVLMLAVPLEISLSVQTLFSFVIFSAVIAVPFFFSGIAVCLSLTRTPLPVGRIYFADLFGAGIGAILAVVLLNLIDAPSGIFVISALLFLSAACYATCAEDRRRRRQSYAGFAAMLIIAGLNASTLHGIQPIWAKGQIDRRDQLAAEVWNPISKIRAYKPVTGAPEMRGPSPLMPRVSIEQIRLDIDNDADTPIMRFQGDLKPFDFLRYDVTSIGAQLRAGGTAAIIGVGGGRDALNCAINGFRHIVGIEVNSAIIGLDTRRFAQFSGFSKIPNFEVYIDEGRSYLTRTDEKFDLIQGSLVNTWAATSAGALTLSENSVYTVEAWQIFKHHLKPGGLIAFSRWYKGLEVAQTYRLFSVACAMLLREGFAEPSRNIAVIASDSVATILVSNQPFSKQDLRRLRSIAEQMQFKILFIPGQESPVPELRTISSARSLSDLARLRSTGEFNYSPVFDSSPYFFNVVRLQSVPQLLATGGHGGNFRALMFVAAFLVAAIILVALTILLPFKRWAGRGVGLTGLVIGGIVYFVAIGLGFMLVEMAMMQQLSIFLGQPIYSLVVVLAGLIISTGIGSLVSDRFRLDSTVTSRIPAFAAFLIIILYLAAVIPVIHGFIAEALWQRAVWSLVLIVPCGFLMGFCFPAGLRWMTLLKQGENLPWMWALNGAAATLGSFVALVISMEVSIAVTALTGAACYLIAALGLPSGRTTRAPAG